MEKIYCKIKHRFNREVESYVRIITGKGNYPEIERESSDEVLTEELIVSSPQEGSTNNNVADSFDKKFPLVLNKFLLIQRQEWVL
jgi:hypothetical protein